MKKIIVYTLVIASLFFNSCMTILGFRNDERVLRHAEIVRLAKRFNIHYDTLYKIDEQKFNEYIKEKKLSGKAKENIEQPLQVIVYNKEGECLSSLINCHIGGFPVLKWNRFRSFDSLPVRQGFFYRSNHEFKKEELHHLLKPVSTGTASALNAAPEYYYYVFWSRLTFRNSKKLMNLLNTHLRKFKDAGVKVYYVFSDSMYG